MTPKRPWYPPNGYFSARVTSTSSLRDKLMFLPINQTGPGFGLYPYEVITRSIGTSVGGAANPIRGFKFRNIPLTSFSYSSGVSLLAYNINSSIHPTSTTTSLTTFALVTSNGATGEKPICGFETSSGNRNAWIFEGNGTTAVFRAKFTDSVPATITAESSIANTVNTVYAVAAVLEIGVGISLYVDGTLAAFTANTNAANQNVNKFYCRAPDTAVYHPPVCAAWRRALSKQEIISLSVNPWQLFEMTPRRIFVPGVTAAPGGFKGAWAATRSRVISPGVH